jgi:5'-nucleotidase
VPVVRLLLTNDDGIHSPGIHALARHLHGAGYDVLVAAPQHDMSGASAGIGHLRTDERIDVTRVPIPGADAVPSFGVAGPPGLAAMAARLGAFGEPPDVVVSGINAGLNTGHSVLHSGTVGAALTAQNFGGSGLAVSIEPTDPWHWQTACEYAAAALAWMIDQAPGCTVLNLNVPGRARGEVRGLRWARLDRFGSVRAAVCRPGGEGTDGLQFEFRATGADLDPDSDTALVEAGYATITTIVGVSEVNGDPGVPCPRVERVVTGAPLPELTIEVPAPPVTLTGANGSRSS